MAQGSFVVPKCVDGRFVRFKEWVYTNMGLFVIFYTLILKKKKIQETMRRFLCNIGCLSLGSVPRMSVCMYCHNACGEMTFQSLDNVRDEEEKRNLMQTINHMMWAKSQTSILFITQPDTQTPLHVKYFKKSQHFCVVFHAVFFILC